MAHQIKLVVNPPSRRTTSTGSPCHSVGVPWRTVNALMGSPAARPYAKQALMTPEKVATRRPFFKLNSLIAARFWVSDNSLSFDTPAAPARTMPSKQTATPNRIVRPERVPKTSVANCPRKIGGISVPNAAVYPRATAMPSDMPRYRIVNPKVRPPNPQRTPKTYVQKMLRPGASCSTPNKSLVITDAKIHGTMIQLKKPPTSQ